MSLYTKCDPHGICPDIETFETLNKIGVGTYGLVYKAKHKDYSSNDQFVALKRIIMHGEDSYGFPVTSMREISILKRASQHPNIVKLLNVAVNEKRDGVFLVFEYCEHDMARLLDSRPNLFTESEVKRLMVQLLSALDFLHSKYIIHRDIKLSNLLYNHR